jgi:hypothetical protein
LHALLLHEGWPCARGRLLTAERRRRVAALELDSRAGRPFFMESRRKHCNQTSCAAPAPADIGSAARPLARL